MMDKVSISKKYRDAKEEISKKSKSKPINVWNSIMLDSEQKAAEEYDREAKSIDRNLKKEKRLIDKLLRSENPRELTSVDIREYANIRRGLPVEKAIEHQTNIIQFQDALYTEQNKIIGKHGLKIDQGKDIKVKKENSKDSFREICKKRIEERDKDYHLAFNRLRIQRKENRQFAMPFHDPEKFEMPDVSRLTRTDYQNLAAKLGVNEQTARDRLSNWIKGVQKLQKQERELKVEYGKAEVALYEQMDKHEHLENQLKDLEGQKTKLEGYRDKLEQNKGDLENKLNVQDEEGLKHKMINLKARDNSLQTELKAARRSNDHTRVAELHGLIEDNKKEIEKQDTEIKKIEEEVKNVDHGITVYTREIESNESQQEKIKGNGYDYDKEALDHINNLDANQSRHNEEGIIANLEEDHGQSEIASKYIDMLKKKHAYEDAKGELRKKLIEGENLQYYKIATPGEENILLYNSDWSMSTDTLVDSNKEKKPLSEHIKNEKLSKELEKGGAARSRRWMIRREISRWMDKSEISKKRKNLKNGYIKIIDDTLEKGDGKIEGTVTKYVDERRTVDTIKMFKDKEYADALAEGRVGIHDSIVKHDGKIAKIKLKKNDITFNKGNYEHPNWEKTKLHAQHAVRWCQRRYYRGWKGRRDSEIEKMDKEFYRKIEEIDREHELHPLSDGFKQYMATRDEKYKNVFDNPSKAPERGPDSGVNYGLRKDYHLSWKQLGASVGSYDQQATKAARHMVRNARQKWDIQEANERRYHTEWEKARVEIIELGKEAQDLHEKMGLEDNNQKKKQYQREIDEKIYRASECQEKITDCEEKIKEIKRQYKNLQDSDYAGMMRRAQELTSEDIHRAVTAQETDNGNKWLDGIRASAYNNPSGNNARNGGGGGLNPNRFLDETFNSLLGMGLYSPQAASNG